MKNTIFTYSNFQIDPVIGANQKLAIEKIIPEGIDFNPLFYNAPDSELTPDKVIDYGIQELFYTQGYDNILILDIDCIPLSTEALLYTFDKISQGYLIGDAQRSHHIENNEHIFVGASCCGFSRETYEKMGQPESGHTNRGDICEEFTYRCEELSIPVEFFVPESYQASPYGPVGPTGASEWALSGDMKPYGIGTTFATTSGTKMFYHLFESRTNLHLDKFIEKCQEVLNS